MRKSKRNKLIVVSQLLIACIIGLIAFADQLKAIGSIRQISRQLYYLEYQGNYGLAQFLEQGGAANDEELTDFLTSFFTKGLYRYAPPKQILGCSTIAAQLPDGGYVFGRNFDLEDCTTLIIRTIPKYGYASISTTNLQFLGIDNDFSLSNPLNRLLVLAAVYVLLDGMNEKGLCISINAIEHSRQTNQNTDKPDLTTTAAVRLLLDYAASVEEAVSLLAQYDQHASADVDYHFAISDTTGIP